MTYIPAVNTPADESPSQTGLDMLRLEMFIDEPTFTRLCGDWPTSGQLVNYNAKALDPELFGWKGIPFRYKSEAHELAWKYYHIAWKNGNVAEQPYALLSLGFPASFAVEYIVNGTIEVQHNREGVGVKSLLVPENYPALLPQSRGYFSVHPVQCC